MLAFLPWEKWLPPYVFGPLVCIGSICLLVFAPNREVGVGDPRIEAQHMVSARHAMYGATG